ncbi:MAG: glycosyltransferase [Candidatus Rokuibacteriota bacterium]
MRILGHLHTFNDEDVIDRSLRALLEQTVPLDRIVIVDNGSTDSTLDRSFLPVVDVIRHPANTGTSGAVISGMRYALQHEFDWLWVFDGDSAPRPEALERLLAFHATLSPQERERVQILASVDAAVIGGEYGVRFSTGGCQPVRLDPTSQAQVCEAVMWSGSLFRLEAVREIGLPSADYVLDCGEFQYGYLGTRCGYKTYVVPSSLFDHNIGGQPSLRVRRVRLGPLSFQVMEFPPIRMYYLIRNNIYFWCHEYHERAWKMCARLIMRSFSVELVLLLLGRHAQAAAAWRGIWDGLLGRMHRRY